MPTLLRPIASLLVGVGFLLIGHGILLTAAPLRGVVEQFSSIEIGLLGAAYYVGFVAGCLLTPFLILRAGHIRSFAALIALAAASALILPLFVDFWPWLSARILTGVSLAGLYLVIESWLNDHATSQNRGSVFSTYIAVNFGAIAVGQLIVSRGDPSTFGLFVLAGLLIGLATIPVVLTKSVQPAPIVLVRFRPIALYRRSPVGVVGVTMIGMATGSFWTLVAFFGVQRGLTYEQAALFLGVAVVGGVLAQWPLGRLSDRLDRRHILIALLSTSATIGILLAVLPLGSTAMLILALPMGSSLLSCYAIATAHAYDHADRTEYVETSAGLLFSNGVGSMIGPIGASALMAAVGPSGLFIFSAAAQLLLVVFIMYRLTQRPNLTSALKTEFTLGATSSAGAVLTPESLDPTASDVAVPTSDNTTMTDPAPGDAEAENDDRRG